MHIEPATAAKGATVTLRFKVDEIERPEAARRRFKLALLRKQGESEADLFQTSFPLRPIGLSLGC
ncbi:MAG: hypothetical protein QM765_08215 [Myxococcales bacterium]